MPTIHPTAVVDSKAEIADDVLIGPFCYVQAGVHLGPGCVLESHASVLGGTHLGARNFLAQGAILGGAPQDRKYKNEPTFLRVGDDNVFREYVTVHRATGEGLSTTVGNRNFLMANVHLGHNCTLFDDITIANNVGCAGHTTIESLVNIGGMAGVHQWARIGRAAMVGGMARITRDVPPFCTVEGDNRVVDINAVGLRRIGVTAESRIALHKAVKLLFKSQMSLTHAIELVKNEIAMTDEVVELIQFMQRLFEGKNGRGDQR